VADPFGLTEGVKGLTDGIEASRAASKGLSQSISNIQQDGVDVAKERAKERRIAEREAELRKERALIKALESWKHKKQISDEEANLKINFVKKYGAKEWDSVLRIKLDIENMERKSNEEYQHDLNAVRRVQFWCFFVAAFIAWYLTWGIK
jgi:hypothetical protein